jgi:3',5'-cyclic AMP phosphodiesterase CpdA
MEINELEPDVVVCSGDLTTFGFQQEYAEAKAYLDQLECEHVVVVPGNHDSRNVGYIHFEELFGERRRTLHLNRVSVVAVDSSEPDLDHGVIGRGRYQWIEEQFAEPADFRIFVLHHHLLPVPGSGRERNVVYDAGDALEILQHVGVNLVLSGHKHVPYAWRLENLFVVNAGTVSSLRIRGKTRPCYNLIEIEDKHVDVWRKYPFHGQERIFQFSVETLEFEKYTARIEPELTRRKRRRWRSPTGSTPPTPSATPTPRPRPRSPARTCPAAPRSSAARPTTACRSGTISPRRWPKRTRRWWSTSPTSRS